MRMSRRQFLKTKGAVLTLPFLHSISPSIAEEPKEEIKPDKKLVIMYVPNGLVRRCFFPGEENGELPGFVGGFNADVVAYQNFFKLVEQVVVDVSAKR